MLFYCRQIRVRISIQNLNDRYRLIISFLSITVAPSRKYAVLILINISEINIYGTTSNNDVIHSGYEKSAANEKQTFIGM